MSVYGNRYGWILIVIAFLGLCWAFSKYLPFAWRGFRQSKATASRSGPRWRKVEDWKKWQGRDEYPIQLAAALWSGYEPSDGTQIDSDIDMRFLSLRMHFNLSAHNPDASKILDPNTMVSAEELRNFAIKNGGIPQFLQRAE